MQIGLMVEGQNGLTWERWSHILALAERLRFPSVFRSDHYFIGTQQSSIEAFLSFVVAAKETRTIRFGSLVAPMTFRSPVDVGRMAAQVSLLSGGRFVLGIGAGWNEPEHQAYGIPFPSLGDRMARLEEAVHVIKALWGPGPADYAGRFFRLEGADCLPKPERLPLLIGGGGERKTLKLVAQHADEWNCVMQPPAGYAHKVEVLLRHCEAAGRNPATIRRSMMTFCFAGHTMAGVEALLRTFFRDQTSTGAELVERARNRRMLLGTTGQIVDTLSELEAHGLQEVMLQHLDFASDDLPEYFAAEIAPRMR